VEAATLQKKKEQKANYGTGRKREKKTVKGFGFCEQCFLIRKWSYKAKKRYSRVLTANR
jgi:hypothetical protein